MSYVILGNDSICRFFDNKKTKKNLWCQIDFLIICNFFWFNHFLIRCQTKVLLYWIHVSLGPKWKNLGSGVPILVGSTASHPTNYDLPYFNKRNRCLNYTVLHIFRQVLFGAGNQGNHQNFEKSLLTNKLWHVLMGMKQKKIFFFEKKISKWPTKKKLIFQFRQFSIFFCENFIDWSFG